MKAISCLGVVAVLTITLLAVGCDRAQRGGAAPASAEATGPLVAQKICPVMGGPIDPSIFLDHQGRRVYFCCQACQAEFKKDPDKYLQKLDEQLKAAQEPARQ